MKTKLLFLAVAFALPFFTNAAVITVSNNPNSPGQYTDLQTAIDAAAPNDILYVHGSSITYGNIYINKPLSLIGGGALPDKTFQLSTLINSIQYFFNTDGTSTASGSSLYGFNVTGIVSFSSFQNNSGVYVGLSNITLKRNKIFKISVNTGPAPFYNFTFQNNIIQNFSDPLGPFRMSNSIISNNIITNISQIQMVTGGNNLLISNNIISGSATYIKGCTISNNIFLNTSIELNTLNTITKNIFFMPNPDSNPNYVFNQTIFETTQNEQNSFSANLYNQNPLFINDGIGALLVDYTYSNPATGPFVNYNLGTTSPGKNYGTDGTDVGIHGGVAPYVQGTLTDSRFRYFPQPAIPQMMEMNILNNTIPQNGTLNVNFTAKKND